MFSGGENVPDYRTLCSLPSAAAALKTTELHFKANRVVRGLRQLQVRWGNQRPLTTKGHGQEGRGNRRSKLKQSDGTPKQDPTVFTRNKGTSKSGKRRDGPQLRQATRACSGCLRPHRGSQQGAVGRGRPCEGVTALNVGTWQLRKAEVREPHPRTENRQGSGQVRSFQSPSGTRPRLVTSSHIAAFWPVPQGKEQRHPEGKGQPPTPRGRTLRGGPEGSAAKAALRVSHLSPALPRGRSGHWKRVFLKNTFTVASNV